MDSIRMRLARSKDADAVAALINTAFRAAESFVMDRDRITVDSVQSLLQSGKFLLAEGPPGAGDDALLGCVYFELKDEHAYLGLLSVNPNHQKGGIGSALMNSAEKHCAEGGCRFMDLRIINVRQELPGFYRRRGYVETGTAPLTAGLQPKMPCHFVNMSKPLP
jgi:ribosomal protein S18 acetylase RimI-like enzyme